MNKCTWRLTRREHNILAVFSELKKTKQNNNKYFLQFEGYDGLLGPHLEKKVN